jgi:tol-pal system protein YbgF
MRLPAFAFACAWLIAPAAAQTAQEAGQMRLYIQQLEERVRQLTGQNEQLTYELNQLRAQGPAAQAPAQTGAITAAPLPGAAAGLQPGAAQTLGAPPDLGAAASISPDDPLIAPDGLDAGGPIDLSVLAGGTPGVPFDPNAGLVDPSLQGTQTAGLPVAPPAATALSGSPRDEYDLAYGYILTGDYDLAEQSFQNWLAAFPSDPQAADAQFWLGESHFQQREFREAANTFLGVYKDAQQTPKAPDALLKLGMSLAALGEKSAACATLAEVGRKYPQASAALIGRVEDEADRAGC